MKGTDTGLLGDVRRFLDGLRDELPSLFSAVKAKKRLPYRGSDLAFMVVEDPQARSSDISHAGGALTLRRGLDRRAPQEVLREWYADRAREIFSQRAAFWAPKLEVSYSRLTIRDQRTVWGSCTKGGHLSFNWRVVMAPAEVLDYLVIHELAHLKEMNHSKRFWAHVSAHCPDWKKHRLWLRDHSRRLKAAVSRGS